MQIFGRVDLGTHRESLGARIVDRKFHGESIYLAKVNRYHGLLCHMHGQVTPLFRKEEVKGNEDLDIVLRKPFEVVDIDRRLFEDALLEKFARMGVQFAGHFGIIAVQRLNDLAANLDGRPFP